MSVLGAETEQLSVLASRLGSTTVEIAEVQSECTSIQQDVCAEMEGSFRKAITSITIAMDRLHSTVDQARGQLDGTTWTGQNRLIFDSAYGDFGQAMRSLSSAVGDAYSEFDAQMRQVSSVMENFQAEVASSMGHAQESTTSMQHAVTAQRENLESVMNTGLSVG